MVKGDGKFFYVAGRGHDPRSERRLLPSVPGQTFIERHRSLPVIAGRSAARKDRKLFYYWEAVKVMKGWEKL